MKKLLLLIILCLISISAVQASVSPENAIFFKYLDRCRPYHSEVTAEYNLSNNKFSYVKNIKGYNDEDMCEVTFTTSTLSKKDSKNEFSAYYCKIPRKKLSKLNYKNFDEKSGFCSSAF